MRFSNIAVAAFAAGAIAKPVNLKRALVTEVSYVTVTLYVTPGQEPTPAPQVPSSDNNAVAPAPTSSVVVPVPEPSSVEAAPPVVVETPPAVVEVTPAPVSTEAPVVVAPAPVSSAAPASSAAAVVETTPTNADPEIAMYLEHHNVHRANHSADALSWDDTLASAAKLLANTCVFKHDTSLGVGGYGQNLAASGPDANTASLLSDGWYNGEAPAYAPYYGVENPSFSDETFHKIGHFTQVVWKSTTAVGCATVDCRGSSLGMWYTVCNYSPPGNYAGQYGKNVGTPLGKATVTG